MSLQTGNADKWIKEGIRHYNAKRYEACLHACERAIQLDPDCARAYHGKGLALAQQRRYEEALITYKIASHLTPENAKIHADMAELFYTMGYFERSGSSYRKAIQFDKQFEAVYLEKSKMLLDEAFKWNIPIIPDLAISAFRRVLLFDPNDVIALAESAKIQEKIQKEKESLKHGSHCYTCTLIYTKSNNNAIFDLRSYQSIEEVRIFLVEWENDNNTQTHVKHSLKYFSKSADMWRISFLLLLPKTIFRIEVLRKKSVIAYGYYNWTDKGYLGSSKECNISLTNASSASKPSERWSEGESNNRDGYSTIYIPNRTGGRNRRARRGS